MGYMWTVFNIRDIHVRTGYQNKQTKTPESTNELRNKKKQEVISFPLEGPMAERPLTKQDNALRLNNLDEHKTHAETRVKVTGMLTL